MLFLFSTQILEVSPSTLETILNKVTLPDLLRFSQTCKDARFLKPQIFDLGLKLKFNKDGVLWVCYINTIFWTDRLIWEKYRHYFPFDGWARGANYYYGTKRDGPDLFDIIEAAKNDDVEYIQNSNYEENLDFEAGDMEYFFHIGSSHNLESDWRKHGFWPDSIWDVFWWYGGPKVKNYIEENFKLQYQKIF